MILQNVITIIGAIIGLVVVDSRLVILIFVYIPLKLLMTHINSKNNRIYTKELNEARYKYISWLDSIINGIREIRTFSLEEKVCKESLDKQNNVLVIERRKNIANKWNVNSGYCLTELMTMLIYLGSIYLLYIHNITIGSIFAFISYSQRVLIPLTILLDIPYLLSGIIPSADRYYSFISEKTERTDGYLEFDLLSNFRTISVNDISFSYLKDVEVICNANFTINRHERIAFIGGNGSGKTTLLNLILKYYSPDTGTIFIDSYDSNRFIIKEYRRLFSVVSQDIYLFNDSIRNNITLCECCDEAYLREIINMSGLSELVEKVGINYNIGQSGNLLSGGQKQKIALARAIYRDSLIFIFDEVTSNTDALTNRQIKKLITTTLKDKTVIVSTHDISMIENFNKIYRIDNSCLREIEYGDL
jgi:ATP-binding cassette subfamily B protein/subfamily B ATP-binding cassette protein MsbA